MENAWKTSLSESDMLGKHWFGDVCQAHRLCKIKLKKEFKP